jgi:DHA2 family multidrug resistance protein
LIAGLAARADAAALMTVTTPRMRLFLGASTVLATLLYSIDSTIVNVALPHIQGSLQATQDQAAWVATAYIVVSAILTPLMGWLGLRYGLRRVLLVSIVGFTVCSVLCGLATSMPQMVAFRAMQGAFGASLIPLSQVTLLQEFPRESYARVMAIWATASMVGPIIGPTVGGYLTDEFSWRWAFYINLPIGVLAWLGFTFAMPKHRVKGHRPFDMTGFILLSLAIGLFQLMLDRGQTKDWFSSPEIVAEAFFSALGLYMFLAHSFTSRHPFVDLNLFRDRNFTMCLLIQGAVGAFVMSPSVLLPVFLQQLQGYTPTQAGVLMASRGASAVVAMLVVSRMPPRFDVRYTMLSGVLMIAVTLWWMATFSIDTPASYFGVAGLFLGFGMPMTFIPTQLIAFSTLPDSSRTEAGVLLRLAVNVGGSVGISLVVAQLARSAQVNQSYLSEYFTAYSLDRWQMIGATPGANVATEGLVGEVSRQALALAYSNDFRLLAATSLICVPLILLMRKVKKSGELPSAADLSH